MVCVLTACGGDQSPSAGSGEPGVPAASPPATVTAGVELPEPAESPEPEFDLSPARPVIEESIAYGEAQDRNLNGVLTLPAEAFEPPPGVLIIHEWWGLDETARLLARRLAGEGFVVLAIDLYGGEVAASSAQAQGLMTRVMTDQQAALDNIRQGIEYLRLYALAPRVATIGWSFGGTWSLQAALNETDIVDAAVMYYGQVATDEATLSRLDSPLLGVFGGSDVSITPDSVVGFRSDLGRLQKNADLRIYPDMQHEFATPGRDNYSHDIAEEAWVRTIEFLNRYLR